MTAKARRPILYVSSTSSKRGRRDIPPSFLNPIKYTFDKDGVLTNNATGLPQLANPQTAGKPRYWVVNFQDIWNQTLTKQDRSMKIDKLKDVLRPYIKCIPVITAFPIEVSIMLFDTRCPVDISNRGSIYTKVIEDLMVKEGIIPDDSVDYINCSGRTKYVRVDDDSKKMMEIVITKSDNTSF